MSLWKFTERHPYRVLLGVVAALAVLVGAAAYFGTPASPGKVSAAQAALGGAVVFSGCLPLLGLVRYFESTSENKGSPGVKGMILGLSMAGELLWIIGALTVSAKFGVSLPGPCAALLSFKSPLVWVLAAGSLAVGFGWGLCEGLKARKRPANLAAVHA